MSGVPPEDALSPGRVIMPGLLPGIVSASRDRSSRGPRPDPAIAFRPPLSFAQVRNAGFYDDAGFCQDCDTPYCYRHWHVSEGGYGYCPRGHGKSLDPHWS